MDLEELSEEELEEALSAPQPKRRGKKVAERSYRSWYYDHLEQSYTKCENPECSDPRGKDAVMTAVIDGQRMCRFCFLGGWLET